MTKQIAFIFPGQGSQSLGMGQALAKSFPAVRDLFQEADDLLGFSISKIAWEGPIEDLNDTINTQPAIFVHSAAVLRVIHDQQIDLHPSFVAGHSMGELSALVASGALSFTDGLRLARIRGELMKQAGEISPGGMAAVMGLDIPQLESICSQASTTDEIVQVANDNCPGQVVISGAAEALNRALPLLEQAGARRVTRLAVSIPAHSPYMAHSQQNFNQAVASSNIKSPTIPIIGNVTAQPLLTAEDIMTDLQNQLTHRVRWTESIRFLSAQGVTEFYEIGNGSVLSGLNKRITPENTVSTLGNPEDINRLIS